MNYKWLFKIIDDIFLPNGFYKDKKVKDTWYYYGKDGVSILFFAKPFYGASDGKFSIALGCFYNEFKRTSNLPQFHESHIWSLGLEQLHNVQEVDKICNMNSLMTEEERIKQIKHLLSTVALPFLIDVSTFEGLIKCIKENEIIKNYRIAHLLTVGKFYLVYLTFRSIYHSLD